MDRLIREFKITDDELSEIITRFGPIENLFPQFLSNILILMRLEKLEQRLARIEKPVSHPDNI